MARTKQYVVYTREFTKGNVNSKVGVFIEEAKNAIDKSGNISGGVIKFKRVLTKTDLESAKTLRNATIGLLASAGKTIINHAA